MHFNFEKVSHKLVILSTFYRIYKCLIQIQSGINTRKLNTTYVNFNPLLFSHYYLSAIKINYNPTPLKFIQNSSSQHQLNDKQTTMIREVMPHKFEGNGHFCASHSHSQGKYEGRLYSA